MQNEENEFNNTYIPFDSNGIGNFCVMEHEFPVIAA